MIRKSKIFLWVLFLAIIGVLIVFWLNKTQPYGEENKAAAQIDAVNSASVVNSAEFNVVDEPQMMVPENPLDSLQVKIGDQTIAVSVRPFEVVPTLLAFKHPQFAYDEMAEKALNGDVEAARLLAQELAHCNESSYANEDDLNQAIKLLRETGVYNSVDERVSGIPVSASKIPDHIASMIRDQNYCKVLTDEQRGKSFYWVEFAAEQGDYVAMNLILNTSDDMSVKHKWIGQKWERLGFLGALESLAVLHISGMIPNEEGVITSDPKLAFAHYLAKSQIQLAIDTILKPDEVLSSSSFAAEIISQLSAGLSAAEHFEAEQLAAQIVKDNPNCCTIENDNNPSIASATW